MARPRPHRRPSVVATAAKACLGSAISFVGALATAATDGSLTLPEWLVAAGAGLTALAVVYRVPNADVDSES